MTDEFEITLAIPSRSAGALGDTRALRDWAREPPQVREIQTTYWDTAGMDLRCAGVTLRMRNSDGGWLQSMKATTDEPFLRREFERAVDGGTPDAALARRGARALLGVRLPRSVSLAPLFTTRVSRTTWLITLPRSAEAELALDRGVLETPQGVTSAICEIEIERKAGRVDPLYELAFALVHEIPRARILFSSKADRGYLLATGEMSRPRHAGSWVIDREWSAGELVARAAADCLLQVQSNFDGVRAASDPRYLHQMRIGVRRLRTLFRITRAARLAPVPGKLRDEARWLWLLLGASRDWDVFAQSTWPRIRSMAGSDPPGFAPFSNSIARLRDESHDALRRALESKRCQKVLLALGWFFAHVARKESDYTIAKLSRRVLDKQHARVCREAAQLVDAGAHQRHRLRIAAKKLRYVGEFFQSLYDSRDTQPYLKALSRLQDVLGELNDVAASEGAVRKGLRGVSAREHARVRALVDAHTAASNARLLAQLSPTWQRFAQRDRFWHKS